jgi:hypothetical protein
LCLVFRVWCFELGKILQTKHKSGTLNLVLI